jgi:hypothetical protein
MKSAKAIIFAILLSGSPASAQKIHDPTWNHGHIDHLPPDVRNAVMIARVGVMRALNRHVERVFNPDRKDTHWGKRKLKRDQ